MGLGRTKIVETSSNSNGRLADVLANVDKALTPTQRLDAIMVHPPSHYGNGTNSDPAKLASLTIESVGKFGAATAEQIDKVAAEVMRGAEEIRDKLRELSEAIKGHSDIASEYVTNYCNQASMVLEGVKQAAEKFKAQDTAEAGQ